MGASTHPLEECLSNPQITLAKESSMAPASSNEWSMEERHIHWRLDKTDEKIEAVGTMVNEHLQKLQGMLTDIAVNQADLVGAPHERGGKGRVGHLEDKLSSFVKEVREEVEGLKTAMRDETDARKNADVEQERRTTYVRYLLYVVAGGGGAAVTQVLNSFLGS